MIVGNDPYRHRHRMHQMQTYAGLAGLFAATLRAVCSFAALLLVANPVLAGTSGVSVYSVNTYTSPCPTPSLFNSITNGNGFQNTMTASGYWTVGLNRQNGQVADKDLCDPERNSSCQDSNSSSGFDYAPNAIAYFTGHGVCQALPNTQSPCTVSSQCTTPFPNTWLPGRCINYPPNIDGPGTQRPTRCYYAYSHFAVTCSSSSVFSNLISYNYTSTGARPTMALGEGNVTWAGAGANGGVNLVVLDISCGALPGTEYRDLGAWAGVHMMLTVAPHYNGDTINVPDRGTAFANGWVTGGLNGSVATAWFNALAAVVGGGCNGTSGMQNASGISGCGSYVAVSRGSTSTEANSLYNSTWTNITNNDRDADGDGYIVMNRQCNYDCVTYPPVLY